MAQNVVTLVWMYQQITSQNYSQKLFLKKLYKLQIGLTIKNQ